MTLKIYNTLTREVEEFKPVKKGKVGIYSCGPTVYWFQHTGNLRTYIFSDILKKVLRLNGYKVNHVINVTDVGHLTSDGDNGEDKMEKAAKKEGKSAKEIAQFYFDNFLEDFKKLNIEEPNKWAWATEHIQEQIEMVKSLEEKGFTYKTSDGIYFDTSRLEDYEKLAKLDIEGLEEGKRVSSGEKKNKTDFALWKFSEEPGIRQQEWDSPWGVGFPGWHVECSAMSSKYLGEQFDIHTGGIDHIPIHHTNEIAQSEACFGHKPWVKYWMHGAFLELKEGKMSKSSGKILTVSDLEEKGFDPLDFRYFCLQTNYRKRLIFSIENLKAAKTARERIKNAVLELEDDKMTNEEFVNEFKEVVNNDLNMPEALQLLWKFLKDSDARGKVGAIKKIDEVLGLDLLKKEELEIPKEVKDLVEKRKKAREEKNFEDSDNLRDEIKELGFIVKDTKDGQVLLKI